MRVLRSISALKPVRLIVKHLVTLDELREITCNCYALCELSVPLTTVNLPVSLQCLWLSVYVSVSDEGLFPGVSDGDLGVGLCL